jgi:hypothetical protein
MRSHAAVRHDSPRDPRESRDLRPPSTTHRHSIDMYVRSHVTPCCGWCYGRPPTVWYSLLLCACCALAVRLLLVDGTIRRALSLLNTNSVSLLKKKPKTLSLFVYSLVYRTRTHTDTHVRNYDSLFGPPPPPRPGNRDGRYDARPPCVLR